jgi:hypothetical protein
VAELMRVLQNGCACGDNRLLGVQTIAEVVGDHGLFFGVFGNIPSINSELERR